MDADPPPRPVGCGKCAANATGAVLERAGSVGLAGSNEMPNVTRQQLEHDLLPFGSDAELVKGIVPFALDGLAQGHATVIVTTPGNIALLREGLGGHVNGVCMIDSSAWYGRPAAAIADYDSALRALTDGGAPYVRLAGQLPPRLSAGELASWTRYESVLNRVFEDRPLWVVCMYDSRVPPQRAMLEDARRTHPTVWKAGARQRSPCFIDPAALLSEIPEPCLSPAGAPTVRLPVDRDPHGWRPPVATAISRSGLSAERVDELLIAISEVVGNAIRHGSGPVQLSAWVTRGEVVCEVRDHGGGGIDPLAGYLPPGGDGTPRGMGLWIARQLSDTLAIRCGPDGTSVRLAVVG
jgi:anti-sigma regulatory factor (Ser/Thr protein kinase)